MTGGGVSAPSRSSLKTRAPHGRGRVVSHRDPALAGGFSTVMALAPEVCASLIEDERTQVLVVPFIGFFGLDDPGFEPADNIAERLDKFVTQYLALGNL